MASPPFSIAETEPAGSDFISQFPANEQDNRDVIESWLLTISTNSGVLRADAMPAQFDADMNFLDTIELEASSGTADVEVVIQNEVPTVRARLLWDESADALSVIMYDTDGTTPAGTLLFTEAGELSFNGSVVLRANSAVAAAITGTGALDAGSITSGFGSINIGSDTLTAGATSVTTLTASSTGSFTGALSALATLELGHASDTTLSRSEAGIIAVEGIPLPAGIPVVSVSAARTFGLTDAQKKIYHPAADTSARTWTIPANGTVAFPIDTVITLINDVGAGEITLAITTDTLVLAGLGTTGSRTLAAGGIATLTKVTTTKWFVSGVGLT